MCLVGSSASMERSGRFEQYGKSGFARSFPGREFHHRGLHCSTSYRVVTMKLQYSYSEFAVTIGR